MVLPVCRLKEKGPLTTLLPHEKVETKLALKKHVEEVPFDGQSAIVTISRTGDVPHNVVIFVRVVMFSEQSRQCRSRKDVASSVRIP